MPPGIIIFSRDNNSTQQENIDVTGYEHSQLYFLKYQQQKPPP